MGWNDCARSIVRLCKITLISGTFLVGSAVAQAAAPKVALVLGGGTARGAAHIGAVKAFVEAGVPIDLIVGTSMGAVVGGLYAAGLGIDIIDEAFESIDSSDLVDLQFPLRGGLFDATSFEIIIDELVRGMTVEDTAIPFAAVATPFDTNEATPLTSGNLAQAVHVSLAVPALFAPVEIEGAFYYDGGLTASVAAGLARDLGADVVIAVSVSRTFDHDPENLLSNALAILSGLTQKANLEQQEAADVFLELGVGDTSYFAFDRQQELVEIGYQDAVLALPAILELLSKRGVDLRDEGDPHVDSPLNRDWEHRFFQGQRGAVERAGPLSVTFDVDLGPGHYRSGSSLYVTAPQSVARLGFDMTGGRLGDLGLGVSGGLGLHSDLTTLSFRLRYRVDAALTVSSELSKDEIDLWALSLAVGYRSFGPARMRSETTFEVGLQEPIFSVEETIEGVGFRGVFGVTAGDTVRGSIELLSSVELDSLLLRLRGFAGGVFSEAEPRQQLGFGRPVMMRGVPFTPASRVLVGNLEIGWQAPSASVVVEAVSVRPRGWAFVDVGYGAPTFDAAVASFGIGAGISGSLFGFDPFDLELDIGYGLSTGVVTFTVRSDVWPKPYRAE